MTEDNILLEHDDDPDNIHNKLFPPIDGRQAAEGLVVDKSDGIISKYNNATVKPYVKITNLNPEGGENHTAVEIGIKGTF